MRVGPLDIQPEVLLAPMAAVTDLPFRTICEEHGVGLTITEFLSANALCSGAEKTVAKMTASLAGRPAQRRQASRELVTRPKNARRGEFLSPRAKVAP